MLQIQLVVREADLNPGPPDFKSAPLTTRQRCLQMLHATFAAARCSRHSEIYDSVRVRLFVATMYCRVKKNCFKITTFSFHAVRDTRNPVLHVDLVYTIGLFRRLIVTIPHATKLYRLNQPIQFRVLHELINISFLGHPSQLKET